MASLRRLSTISAWNKPYFRDGHQAVSTQRRKICAHQLSNIQTEHQNIFPAPPPRIILISRGRITLTSGWSRGTCGGFGGSFAFLKSRGCSAQCRAGTMLMRGDGNGIDTSDRGIPAAGGGNQVLAEVICLRDPAPAYLQDLPPHFDANAPFWLFQSAAHRLL